MTPALAVAAEEACVAEGAKCIGTAAHAKVRGSAAATAAAVATAAAPSDNAMGHYHWDTARSGCSGDGSATAASSDPSAAAASHYIHERAEAVLIAHHLTAGGARSAPLEAPTVDAAAAAPARSTGRREGRGRWPVNSAEAPHRLLVVRVKSVAMVRVVNNAAAVREGADAHWIVAAEPMRRGGKENARRRGHADTAPAAAAGAVVVRCRGGLAKGGLGRRAVTGKGVNGRCWRVVWRHRTQRSVTQRRAVEKSTRRSVR